MPISPSLNNLKKSPSQWYSRGYLPHFTSQGLMQFVTIRLADSLPREVIERIENQIKITSGAETPLTNIKRADHRRKAFQRSLDQGYGSCIFQDPATRTIVENALLHRVKAVYNLHAYTIMPNHIHILFTLNSDQHLMNVMRDFKSFTARQINCLRKSKGEVWHRDYFDRYIRDSDHEKITRKYIEENPVKAGLVRAAHEFHGTSAAKPWTG